MAWNWSTVLESAPRSAAGRFLNEQIGRHAPGAWPNGTRVQRAILTARDLDRVKDEGEVVGSVGPVIIAHEREYAYLVAWDDFPAVPILTLGYRLERIDGS